MLPIWAKVYLLIILLRSTYIWIKLIKRPVKTQKASKMNMSVTPVVYLIDKYKFFKENNYVQPSKHIDYVKITHQTLEK